MKKAPSLTADQSTRERALHPPHKDHQKGDSLIIACPPPEIKEENTTMKNQEERTQLIAAILPLLEKMPLVWLRATLITAEKRAERKGDDVKGV